jgi:hypothetical protein
MTEVQPVDVELAMVIRVYELVRERILHVLL